MALRGYGHDDTERLITEATVGARGDNTLVGTLSSDPPIWVEDGDSGGTWVEAGRIDPPVLGVTHGGTRPPLDTHYVHGAFIWGAPQHDWLWSVLDPGELCALDPSSPSASLDCVLPGATAPLDDADGDGLPDVNDLCSDEALQPGDDCDGQHCDDDGDWVGNECDDYPALCNHDDPDGDGVPSAVDPCPEVYRESADDFDGDGVPDDCDKCFGVNDEAVDFEIDIGDLDGVPDACDNCEYVDNPSQANCNLDMEVATGDLLSLTGDACDLNPCPSAGPAPSEETEEISPVEFVRTNGRIEGLGVVKADAEGTLRTGFRFCPCDTTEDSIAQRARCAIESGCEQAYDLYGNPAGAWKPMSIGWNAETTYEETSGGIQYDEIVSPYLAPSAPVPCDDEEPGAFCSRFFDGTWDFVTDGSETGDLVEEAWGQRLGAVVWSRAVSYADADDGVLPFGCNLSSCPDLDGDLNSHYWSGETRRREGFRWPMPAPPEDIIDVAALPHPACPLCDRAMPLPYFFRECDLGKPCIRYRASGASAPGAVDGLATDLMEIDPRILALMEDPSVRWLAAGEPPEALRDGAARLLAYRNNWIEITAVASGTALRTFGVHSFTDELGAQGDGLLLSGSQYSLSALGGLVDGEPATTIRTVSLLDGSRETLPIEGPLIEEVVSASLHASGRQAAVLHRVSDGSVRLVWVDLSTGVTTTATDDLWPETYDRHQLSSLADGGYVLLAWSSEEPMYKALVFSLGPAGLAERATIEGSEQVLGSVRGAATGVSFLVSDPEAGFVPTGHRLESLDSNVDNEIYAMF